MRSKPPPSEFGGVRVKGSMGELQWRLRATMTGSGAVMIRSSRIMSTANEAGTEEFARPKEGHTALRD